MAITEAERKEFEERSKTQSEELMRLVATLLQEFNPDGYSRLNEESQAQAYDNGVTGIRDAFENDPSLFDALGLERNASISDVVDALTEFSETVNYTNAITGAEIGPVVESPVQVTDIPNSVDPEVTGLDVIDITREYSLAREIERASKVVATGEEDPATTKPVSELTDEDLGVLEDRGTEVQREVAVRDVNLAVVSTFGGGDRSVDEIAPDVPPVGSLSEALEENKDLLVDAEGTPLTTAQILATESPIREAVQSDLLGEEVVAEAEEPLTPEQIVAAAEGKLVGVIVEQPVSEIAPQVEAREAEIVAAADPEGPIQEQFNEAILSLEERTAAADRAFELSTDQAQLSQQLQTEQAELARLEALLETQQAVIGEEQQEASAARGTASNTRIDIASSIIKDLSGKDISDEAIIKFAEDGTLPDEIAADANVDFVKEDLQTFVITGEVPDELSAVVGADYFAELRTAAAQEATITQEDQQLTQAREAVEETTRLRDEAAAKVATTTGQIEVNSTELREKLADVGLELTLADEPLTEREAAIREIQSELNIETLRQQAEQLNTQLAGNDVTRGSSVQGFQAFDEAREDFEAASSTRDTLTERRTELEERIPALEESIADINARQTAALEELQTAQATFAQDARDTQLAEDALGRLTEQKQALQEQIASIDASANTVRVELERNPQMVAVATAETALETAGNDYSQLSDEQLRTLVAERTDMQWRAGPDGTLQTVAQTRGSETALEGAFEGVDFKPVTREDPSRENREFETIYYSDAEQWRSAKQDLLDQGFRDYSGAYRQGYDGVVQQKFYRNGQVETGELSLDRDSAIAMLEQLDGGQLQVEDPTIQRIQEENTTRQELEQGPGSRGDRMRQKIELMKEIRGLDEQIELAQAELDRVSANDPELAAEVEAAREALQELRTETMNQLATERLELSAASEELTAVSEQLEAAEAVVLRTEEIMLQAEVSYLENVSEGKLIEGKEPIGLESQPETVLDNLIEAEESRDTELQEIMQVYEKAREAGTLQQFNKDDLADAIDINEDGNLSAEERQTIADNAEQLAAALGKDNATLEEITAEIGDIVRVSNSETNTPAPGQNPSDDQSRGM